jgi:PAS domain S-box-containing protein
VRDVNFLHRIRDAFRPPWSLRAYLFAFGLTLILPGLLFAAIGIAWIRMSDRAAQDRATLETARSIATDLDRHLSGMITTLRALSTSEPLEQGDFTSFYRQAKRALPEGETNIVVRNLDNRQVLNTRVPWGVELGMSGDPPPDPALVKKGEPWISDLFHGATAKVPLYSVNVPVTLADGRVLVLNMSQPAASLSRFLASAGIEKPWGAGISDRSNHIIARSEAHDAHVGKPLTPETLRQSTSPEGVFHTVNRDGEHVLRAHIRSPMSGWTIAVWVPLQVADARYWRSLRLVLLGGAGLLLLSTLLAMWFGGMIAKPINAISVAATRLGRSEEPPQLPNFPLQEANAVAGALHGAATQLSERRAAIQNSERRIREAHDRMALALDVTGLGMWERDLVTGKITWSEGMYRIFGRTREEFGGTADEVLSYVHSDDRAAFRGAFQENVQKGTSGFGQDFRVVRPDGEIRWVLRRAQLVRNENGALTTMLGVALDLTERRDKEEHITFLMRELAHRSKNLVAVIQAIAHQTARNTENVPDFVDRFSARLVSMARTHDLLTGKERGGALLKDLIHSQIDPFEESSGRQVTIDGPAAILDEVATQNIGLALHELATNAAKYGALSVPHGKVSVSWQPAVNEEGGRTLRLIWRETNGPTVTPPERKGFGHIVIQRTVADSVDAEVTLDFASTGVVWQVDIPARHYHLSVRPAETEAVSAS